MGRNKIAKTLSVYFNEDLVGFLKKETNGAISFKYDENWIPTDFAISNSLPIREDAYRGEVVTRYFDNLLPDNDEIRKKVATKLGAESVKPFDMLEVIGRDCVGALTFLAEGMNLPVDKSLRYKVLTEAEIATRIRNLSSSSPLGMEDGEFRLSIAGAQEKTAFLRHENQWCEPIGMTPTTHIFKKSIGALNEVVNFDDSIDNEWASLFLMRKFGLNTCKATIEVFEDQKVLSVLRFDRVMTDEGNLFRLPQEDFCQVFQVSPYKKYQREGGPGIVDICKFLRASREKDDIKNFLKAILVFDLLYAIDGHAKNFSIFLETNGFRLTPFYDVMSGYFLISKYKRRQQDMKLAMKVGNDHYRFDKIFLSDYVEMAKKCGIGQDDFMVIVFEIAQAYKNLKIEDHELDKNLNRETLNLILEGMKKRANRLFELDQ